MAMGAQTFRYSHQWGGWWITTAPTRSMSSHARYYAFHERSEFPHEDCEGRPYVFTECPWCSQTLPGCLNIGQADGSEGPE